MYIVGTLAWYTLSSAVVCGCKKSYSSGDFKEQRASAYNCNVQLSVNSEQDRKV